MGGGKQLDSTPRISRKPWPGDLTVANRLREVQEKAREVSV
jgi:hypothetical protein